MTDPPSQEELATSDQAVWTHALAVASQSLALDLSTVGILDHIRHLIVTGQLVDREATDDMEKMWVCLFDGRNDLCEQGKMTSKHQELCGEFWLLPIAAAIETQKT